MTDEDDDKWERERRAELHYLYKRRADHFHAWGMGDPPPDAERIERRIEELEASLATRGDDR